MNKRYWSLSITRQFSAFLIFRADFRSQTNTNEIHQNKQKLANIQNAKEKQKLSATSSYFVPCLLIHYCVCVADG